MLTTNKSLFILNFISRRFRLKAGLQYEYKAKIYFDNLISRYLFFKLLDSLIYLIVSQKRI